MASNNSLKRIRTWYGMHAIIEIRSRSFHRAGFGKLLILHPPVVNWLLRYGLADKPYQQLSITHEYAHFQTLPILLIYILIAIVWGIKMSEIRWFNMGIVFFSIHAMAEILAEAYVRVKMNREYAVFYQNISIFPRLIFWSIFTLISAAGWIVMVI
ncbi:hypothetical protein ACX8XP_14675 [Calditrichota bacterium LG25]